MAEVPQAQPTPPAPEPQPPLAARPADPAAPNPEAPAERWNPLKTPFAWIVLALQIGVVAWAGYQQTQIGGTWENYSAWLENHGWTLRDMTQVWSEPWRLFTCLVAETLHIQVIMNVMIWWSAGPALEKIFKTRRLVFLYVVGGLGCFFACDFLHHFFPHTFGVSQGRSAARHAVIACSGSIVGLLLAVEGLKATLTSRLLWSQVFSIGLAFLLTVGLSRGGAQVGFDWAGMTADLVGGSIFGFALALTLLRGTKKIVGYLLCAGLLFGVGVETVIEAGRAFFSDRTAFNQQKTGSQNDGSKGGSVSGTDPHRLPEEAATPRPTLPDEEADPPEIAKKRKAANALLSAYGPLPWPSGDPDDQRAARKVRDELVYFEERWTKSASANLEVEMAELSLICEDYVKAEALVDAGLKVLDEANLSPTKVLGTLRGKRIARLHGVLAIAYMKKPGGEEIAAEQQLHQAESWDPELLEVHFYLGKLAPPGSPDRKKELRRYMDGVGASMPTWRRQHVIEAKQLLGGE